MGDVGCMCGVRRSVRVCWLDLDRWIKGGNLHYVTLRFYVTEYFVRAVFQYIALHDGMI